jgi:pyruvate/2-oxoglutarate dehydrogenase complex dihydrolipoamide acyltransferase (E2) component
LPFEVFVPRHRWSRASLLFDRWLLDDGDWVKHGNSVCTLDVNGVSVPVASEHDGFLTVTMRDLTRGRELQPGSVIGYVTRPSESAPSSPEVPPSLQLPARHGVEPLANKLRHEWEPPVRKRAASPRARRAARKANVPLRALRGTGYRGRVTERDVHAAAPAIAASGGNVAPAWIAAQRNVADADAGDSYTALCRSQASTILLQITGDDLSQCESWNANELELISCRLENSVTTYHRLEDGIPHGKQVAEDEVDANMIPMFWSNEARSTMLIPPLPSGALFSLGFSAVVASPIVVAGKVTAGHVLTVSIAFDSQRLQSQTVERWLAASPE